MLLFVWNCYLAALTTRRLVLLMKPICIFIDIIDNTSLDFSDDFIRDYFRKMKTPVNKELVQLMRSDEAVIYQYIFKAGLNRKVLNSNQKEENISKPIRVYFK